MQVLAFIVICFTLTGAFADSPDSGASNQHYVSNSVTTLSLQVEPRTEECFYEEITSSTSVSMMLFVVRGGLLDIRLRVSHFGTVYMHLSIVFLCL
jgi:hypothetical protein